MAKVAKILIVDDSPTQLHVLATQLSNIGHQILTAADGRQAVDVAKAEHPDLILMDIVMPGMNGFQATRKISRDPATRDIPVIMVTTKDQKTDKEWGMRQGACAYMVKPVKAGELQAKIDELLH